MKELLDAAPKYITVVSFLVLTVTVVHEYGYFVIIGSHLQTIATTYDYLANAFIWLPTAMGAVFALQALETAMPIEKARTDAGTTTYQIKHHGLFYFVWILAGIGVLMYLLLGGTTVALSVTTLVGLTAIYFLTRNLKGDREKLTAYRLTAFGIYLALLAYGYGVRTGYLDLAKSEDVYAIEQKDGQGPAFRQLVLLRIFEKGLLVRDLPAQRVEFLRWDSVTRLSRLLPKPNATKGYLCIWFDVTCGRRGVDINFEP
jgi:hypothetical protein